MAADTRHIAKDARASDAVRPRCRTAQDAAPGVMRHADPGPVGSPIGNLMLQSVLCGRRPPAVQCASRISMPGDPWEQEAEWVADAVVSGPPAATGCTCGTGTPCTACGEEPPISRTAAHAGTPVASPSSDARPAGPGQPLDRASRSFFENRFGRDFSDVRVHTDRTAAASAHALAAEAYTTGRDIVFAQGRYAPESGAGQRLLAHELTHVVQQEGGSPLMASSAGGRGVIHRQADAGVAMPPATTDIVTQVEDALTRTDPDRAGGAGDFPAAYSILNGLAMFDLLPTLRQLHVHGRMKLLWAHLGEAVGVNVERLRTAFIAERLSRPETRRATIGDLVHFASGLESLPDDQVNDVERFLLGGPIAQEEAEGIEAFMDGRRDTLPSAVRPAAVAPAAAGMMSTTAVARSAAATATAGGALYPRGKQHFGYWLGNIAHRLIGAYYETRHPGQAVYTNYIELSTLLPEAGSRRGITPDLSKAGNLKGKPDITNLSLWELFEIKSMRRMSLAAAQAQKYVNAFRSAGIFISLGRSSDAGASGYIPLAFAELRFASTEDGAIGYKFKMRKKSGNNQETGEAGAKTETGEMSDAARAALVVAAIGVVAACILLQPELLALVLGAAETAAETAGAVAGEGLLTEETFATEVELSTESELSAEAESTGVRVDTTDFPEGPQLRVDPGEATDIEEDVEAESEPTSQLRNRVPR